MFGGLTNDLGFDNWDRCRYLQELDSRLMHFLIQQQSVASNADSRHDLCRMVPLIDQALDCCMLLRATIELRLVALPKEYSFHYR